MEFQLSRQVAEHFEFTSETGSTNQDLVERALELPHFAVLATDFQIAGRGRLERSWEAKSGSSIMASILLHSNSASPALGWVSLILAESIRAVVSEQIRDVSVKWPNDVLVGQRKVAGILAQFLPSTNSVIVGFGLNVTQTQAELPIETATSLKIAGAQSLDRDQLLSEILKRFRTDFEAFAKNNFNPEGLSIRDRIIQGSGTLNKQVRIIYPDGSEKTAKAIRLDEFGRLVVNSDGAEITVSSADIQHLRIA